MNPTRSQHQPHRRSCTLWLVAGLSWTQLVLAASQPPGTATPLPPLPDPLPPALAASVPDGSAWRLRVENLAADLNRLRPTTGDPWRADTWADTSIFYKSILWALRYETQPTTNDWKLMTRLLTRAEDRAEALRSGNPRWPERKGKVLRGFISAVDGSVQPYGLLVPASYDGRRPMRLDVVLHGSSRPVGLSEARFIARFDEGDDGGTPGNDPFLELHPLGRVENCYRWAGETDVFEAIEAVCRNYRIDRDRIVLRGMSMGASGAWHLGLKHPDQFVALGPYCGYVDTHRFSETPVPGFIKVGPLPWHQERGLHLLDSVDYAANVQMVPTVAAIGDQDVFFQAHVIMGEAMAREGLMLVNLIAPGTGHVIDPKTHAEQLARIGRHAEAGVNRVPRNLRFVTWTLKYHQCHWLKIQELDHHYQRAEFTGQADPDGTVRIETLTNLRRLSLLPPVLQSAESRLLVQGAEIPLPKVRGGQPRGEVVLHRRGNQWVCQPASAQERLSGKRPGLQGPIDDAFTAPFLCVRGTGQPWNPAVGAWCDASLRRFRYEWARYMRGDLPVKDDTEVTAEDIRTRNLVLFGDPGSNIWIRRSLPRLPLTWTRRELRLGAGQHSSADHAPALICPNPLPGGGQHYLVLNSGHTFHEPEFAAFNYLLFPRLGDWAVLKILPEASTWIQGSLTPLESPVDAGFFDESWKKARGETP